MIGLIHNCLDDTLPRYTLKRPEKDYSHYVHNIDNIVASEVIINEIFNKVETNLSKVNTKDQDVNYNGEFFYFTRRMVGKILPWGKVRRSYISHKFDRLTVAEVKKVLNVYSADGANKFEFKCERAGHNMVNIYDARTS